MLTIRNEQLVCFASQHRAEFVDRLVPHLSASYPSWYKSLEAEDARAFVERAIDAGASVGVRGQWAVGTLIELMIEFGETFERSPDRDWATTLLAHPALPDRLKLTMLSERLRARTGGCRVVEVEARES